ncbi:MAG: protein kinase [Magnetococcales bacterium]|nr:protein kinase [Magnetococcales bacterium]
MTPSLRIGDIINHKYQVRSLLGHGSLGIFHLAEELSSKKLVTLQTLPYSVSHNETELAQFSHLVGLWQQIDHPCIAKPLALEHDIATDTHILVMEHVEGVDLHTKRLASKQGIFSIPEAEVLCQQIADALDFAHRFLPHRNLQPQNILITPNNEIKILNFDLLPEPLSRDLRTRYLQKHPEKTLQMHNHLAPEQWSGTLTPGPAADCYSLAVLFYEMTTGQMPFHSLESQAVRYARPLGRKRNKILLKALSKNPEERFFTGTDFINTIKQPRFSLPELPTRWISASTGLMMAAGVSWLVVMAPPMSAPSSPVPTPTPEITLAAAEPPATTPLFPIPDSPTKPNPTLAQPAASESNTDSLLLRVETRPQGATLSLDGKKLGNTPFTVGRVKVGFHTLSLEKEGYNPVSFNLELNEDTVVDLTLDNMEPAKSANKPPSAEQPATTQQAESKPTKQETQESANPVKVAQQIATLLETANQHFKADRLTKPKGKNALESYQKILELAGNHSEAKQGIGRITTRLVALAQDDLENWRLVNALKAFRGVAEIDPANPEVQAGLEEIVDRYLNLAQRFVADTDKARDYLKQAEEILPELPRTKETRAKLFPQDTPPPKSAK